MTTKTTLFSSYASLQHSGERGEDVKPETADQTANSRILDGRLCDVTQNWTSESSRGDCYLTGHAPGPKDGSNKRFGSSSLLLRRNVHTYSNNREPQLQLEIQSETLQDVFRQVAPNLQSVNVHANPIIIKAPYHELYHFRDELAAAGSGLDWRSKNELGLLRKFVDDSFRATAREVESLEACRQISMEYLWAIFKPGECVLLRRQDHAGEDETCCGILKSFVRKTKTDGSTVWSITMQSMSFDSGRCGVIREEWEFPTFSGQVNISALSAYPLRFALDPERIKEDLVSRGRRYIELCRGRRGSKGDTVPAHMTYHGPVWIQRKKWEPNGCDFYDAPERMISGRVMIDPEGYVNEHPLFRKAIIANSLLTAPISQSFDSESVTNVEESLKELENVDPDSFTSEELMTFPSRVGGYSLVTKDAGFFQVDGFTPVKWEKQRVDNTLQSSLRMQKVFQIASGFSFLAGQFHYQIENKGRGLIFLLYGLSGTGKTLTAECVAEALHLPLYRVSGSDLGSEAYQVEGHLTKAFNRMSRWEAILLFDEADAFMTKRSDDSLERNAMVSVLLRLLEYQSGIIILTTNRRTDFDPAFHSRIQVSIEYDALTSGEKEGIWRWEVKKAWPEHAISDADFKRLAQLDLDGRTIKNVVHVQRLSHVGAGNTTPVSLSNLKPVLEIATGNVSGEAKRQVDEFCRELE